MAQKHLQLLRNGSAYANYQAAYQELTGKTSYADGTPILARYSGETGEIKTLLGVVNKAVTTPRVDIINDVQASILRAYNLEEATSGAIATNDSIEVALNKLENQVIAAKAAATTKVVEGTDTGNNMTIVPTTGDDNSVTYTVNLTDVASKNALDAEIQARKDVDGQTGQTYAANANANYISTATSLNDADVKLDAALKAEETARKEIEGQNGSAYTQNAGSRYISGASNMNDADVKLDQAVSALSDNLDNIVEGLSAGTVFDENKVVVDVTQEDGKITATAANLTGVKLNGYTEGTDADIAATDTLGQALGKLQAQINAMDKTASAVDGQVVTTVVETDGKVTETKANVKDLQLGGYVKDTAATGAIGGTDTINTALSKLENKVGANKITNADGSITVTEPTGTATTTDVKVNIKSGEKVIKLDGEGGGIYTNLNLVKITESLPATVKERYEFRDSDNVKIGESIDIAKDSHIVSITYITNTGDTHYQNLEYKYIDASGNTQTEYVDISSLVLEAEFASGVTVTNHVAHGVVDTASEKDENNVAFLTVGADGFKVSGIKDAIDTKINKLDVTGDTAVAGQYITHINEEDGKIQIGGRADISKAPLNDYAKGTDASAVAATDTVNQAISKLENQIDAATTVVEHNTGNTHVTVSSSTASDGHTIYTVNEDDIASATALTAEIAARKAVDGQSGQAYAANSNTNYITGATSLNDADVKLDAALKAEENARIAAIEALDVTGDTAVAGQYVAAIQEADGIVSVKTRANVSEAVLNNYSKGTDATTVAATDTVNQAISKLENQIDGVKEGYLTGVTVNGVTGNVADNVATVVISGSSINLGTGYTGSESGAPTTADTVNQAIAKLYNKSNANTSTGKTITITSGESSTNFEVNVDNTTAATSAMALYESANHNAIQDTTNGLYVSSIWDCGTYDEPAGN